MTRTIQLLRGTTAQNAAFTGASGEVTVDTQTHELRVHDGSTAGGHIIPNKAECQGLLGGGTAGTLLTNSGTPGTVNATSIDATPTDGSDNPVSSDGVYDALAAKADTATTLSGYGITDGANTDLSNLTATGKGKLGPKVYQVIGYVVNSATAGSAVAAYGICRVELYPNGLAIIDFNLHFTASGTSGDFNWGLNRDILHNLNANIPTITPISGTCSYYDASGVYPEGLNGNSGTLTGHVQFWTFGRLYDTAGNIGGWGASQLNAGHKVIGRCYGTYTV